MADLGKWILSSAVSVGAGLPLQLDKPKALDKLGFYNGVLHRESLGLDVLTFERAVAGFDEAPDYTYGELVSLKDPAGVQRFVGRRIVVPGRASGTSETHTYVFAGPWFWMQRVTYRQTWAQLLINGALVSRATSHLLLNVGDRQSAAAQITHVLNHAIDNGAPFQIGTVDIPVVPFTTEITDQRCDQVVADQLRFAPDAVTWFDYSTNPPTFHCRSASALTAVNLSADPDA